MIVPYDRFTYVEYYTRRFIECTSLTTSAAAAATKMSTCVVSAPTYQTRVQGPLERRTTRHPMHRTILQRKGTTRSGRVLILCKLEGVEGNKREDIATR